MTLPESGWSIRSLLSPVSARLLIYGMNPFDLERVLRRMEATPLRNARQMETLWLDAWDGLARAWGERSFEASRQGHSRTAQSLGLQSAACRLAQFLINTGEVSRKRAVYLDYAESYRRAASLCDPPAVPVEIPLDVGSSLAAVLHLPRGSAPHACAAVLSGLGSCKEEMHTLARMLTERGVAALVPDMPGNGESLFHRGVSLGQAQLSSAFRGMLDFVAGRGDLDGSRFGVLGLCMGGGYAFRACAEEPRFRFCATLFPLFLDRVEEGAVPLWMRRGDWFDLQVGGKSPTELVAEVGLRDGDRVACPFFLVHGRHDNWMTLERAMLLFEHAHPSQRRMLVVDDEAAYATGQSLTHSMPVGEQLGWVGPLVADWIAKLTAVGALAESGS
jgi:dienelactone hydrolase